MKFCVIMNIAPMHENSYSDYVKAIHKAAQSVAKSLMSLRKLGFKMWAFLQMANGEREA